MPAIVNDTREKWNETEHITIQHYVGYAMPAQDRNDDVATDAGAVTPLSQDEKRSLSA